MREHPIVWRLPSSIACGSRKLSGPEQLDPRRVPAAAGQPSVQCDEGRLERLGQGEIRRVIHRDVAPQNSQARASKGAWG